MIRKAFAVLLLFAAASGASRAAEVNVLAMGDWGNNGPGQRMVAGTMKSYIGSSGQTFDAMLLYNDTSATKLAVAVFTFGSQTVTAGTFTLTMPAHVAATALVRIA